MSKAKIKKLSELRKEADDRDFLGRHMEVTYFDDDTNEWHLTLRSHDLPSYGYCDPEYEDTPEWYDDWWSLFADINITKKIIERHYVGPNYDSYKVIVDDEIDLEGLQE